MKYKGGKYLDFYKQHYGKKLIVTWNDFELCGLCGAMNVRLMIKEVEMFAPINGEYGWWGGNLGEFNPLRQTIVLFLAAMNGELEHV